MENIKIAPSVFAADLGCLKEQLAEMENAGADLFHVDVMDGHFVERMAFGADHIRVLKSLAKLPLDVHMIASEPERHLDSILQAGADIITVHAEATTRLLSCMQKIHRGGAKAGVVLNPATSEEVIRYLLDDIDMVLLMTVNPGDRVVDCPNMVCHKCKYCLSGHPARNLIKMADSMTFEEGALVEPATVSLHGLYRCPGATSSASCGGRWTSMAPGAPSPPPIPARSGAMPWSTSAATASTSPSSSVTG